VERGMKDLDQSRSTVEGQRSKGDGSRRTHPIHSMPSRPS
jgi:hypothetical protein